MSSGGANDPPALPDSAEVQRSRLDVLEARVAKLSEELAVVRRLVVSPPPEMSERHDFGATRERVTAGRPASRTIGDRLHASTGISSENVESLVGRYGTLGLAAVVILMAVGAVIKMAVQNGVLTPEVRVGAGALTAGLVAAAGAYFRQRGDRRYGNVLLAISLAIVDLVAWGAGPRLHLMRVSNALIVVDLVAIAFAMIALHDESEFLFCVSVAGALSAPYVTTDGGGSALNLLLYGISVLAGSLRVARQPGWARAFWTLVAGALVYAFAASGLPISPAWYGGLLITSFAAACALAALLLGERDWLGELPRAYLAVGVVGLVSGWDAMQRDMIAATSGVAVLIAGVTYAALFVHRPTTRYWAVSAVLLPLVSLGMAYAGADQVHAGAVACAAWTFFALVAWLAERARSERDRAGAHLLCAAVAGLLAVFAWLWSNPLELVAGLAGWGFLLAILSRNEASGLPQAGVGAVLLAGCLSAFDQLASRSAFSFVPFSTRSSASAGLALAGLLAASTVLGGASRTTEVASRSVRFGVPIGFAILWGRMELADAFNADVAAFLLTCYYAACGLASILAGRHLSLSRLRLSGLVLSVYAALKALVVVTDIVSVGLRVGAWVAVGAFLLGAGYLYREAPLGEVSSGEARR